MGAKGPSLRSRSDAQMQLLKFRIKKWFTTVLDVVKILFPSSNFLFEFPCWRENQNRRYSLNLSRIPAYPSLVGRCTSVYCEWQRLMSRSKEVKQEIIKVPFLDSKVTLHSKSPESDSR